MILGLDINTVSIGYCLMNDNAVIALYGVIDLSLHDEILFDKIELFSDEFSKKIQQNNHPQIHTIVIESALKSFAFGKTNTNTLIKLVQINTLISYWCYLTLKIKPDFIHPSTLRKRIFGSIPRNIDIKEYATERIHFLYPALNLPKRPRRTDKYVEYAYDICDAITCALSGLDNDNIRNIQRSLQNIGQVK